MFKIQMQQDSSWWTLGGLYDAATADERIMQFMAACSHGKGSSRQFRRVRATELIRTSDRR